MDKVTKINDYLRTSEITKPRVPDQTYSLLRLLEESIKRQEAKCTV